MTEYLFAIQDAGGREACSVRVVTDRVSEVSGHLETGRVSIRRNGEVLCSAAVASDDGFVLVRVPADDKTARPIVHSVVKE